MTALTASCEHAGAEAPACAQPIRLQPALEQFRRDAVWQTCATGRYRCPYVVWGQGPALVFVPGLCDDPWTFVLPMARLHEQFRCVAYAMPTGRGDGARLRGYRHADLVLDLFALLDHLGLRQAYLLGVSFGATVALAALHERPQRFPRTILQGGFAQRRLAWAEVLLAAWARWWPGTLEQLPLRRWLFRQIFAESFQNCEPDVFRYFLEHDGAQPIAAVAQRALLLHRIDLRRLLPAIRQPILLVCGDRDPLVGKTCEQDLLRGLPHVARAEIEHCGHMPQYTQPEVLCEVVRRFLLPGERGCEPPLTAR